jgi:hypothetical protein
MFYNGDPDRVLAKVLAFIDAFTKELKIYDVLIEVGRIRSVINGGLLDFPHKDGVHKASPFKLAANFVCNFIAEQPIRSPFGLAGFGQTVTGKTICGIENHQNAVVAYHLACFALEGATIRRGDGTEVIIRNPIWVSQHSYCDIIDALSVATPVTHFKMVTVLLEQLVYKSNLDCQYEK